MGGGNKTEKAREKLVTTTFEGSSAEFQRTVFWIFFSFGVRFFSRNMSGQASKRFYKTKMKVVILDLCMRITKQFRVRVLRIFRKVFLVGYQELLLLVSFSFYRWQ